MFCSPKPKVPYFFISLEKFIFVTFLTKSSEWVKTLYFFFSDTGNKKIQTFEMSEWVRLKLFQEKKNTRKKNTDLGKKKIQRKMGLKMAILKKYCFPPIFLYKLLQKSWVSGTWTFPGKKNTTVFFFPLFGKKNTDVPKFEWVSEHKLFRGKNKIRYLWASTVTN